jgi:hypothetical protein
VATITPAIIGRFKGLFGLQATFWMLDTNSGKAFYFIYAQLQRRAIGGPIRAGHLWHRW